MALSARADAGSCRPRDQPSARLRDGLRTRALRQQARRPEGDEEFVRADQRLDELKNYLLMLHESVT